MNRRGLTSRSPDTKREMQLSAVKVGFESGVMVLVPFVATGGGACTAENLLLCFSCKNSCFFQIAPPPALGKSEANRAYNLASLCALPREQRDYNHD